jgi:diaminopimelate epimerase
MAVDGVHHAVIEEDQVKLQMKDVSEVQVVHGAYFLDTGSPHHVALVDAVLDVNVPEVGASIRYGQYGAQGANINFVTPNKDGSFFVRTYERGVEDETLSCGTGVTAVAIAMHYAHKTEQTSINVQTPGGDLQVSFEQSALGYEKIFLTGGAVHVFDGSIWIDD